ncbi:MAG: flavodoxin family protein [Chloroflexota bacterium]
MRAIVVYESHWGNTAAVARAIAEGIGPETRVMSTAEATAAAIGDADLIVVGSPILGFRLPNEGMLQSLAANAGKDPVPPDLSHPSMRTWLERLPKGSAAVAAFETRIWWSPGSAAKTILQEMEKAGYHPIAKPQKYIVKDKYGPLRDGELDKAKAWGEELARSAK